MRISRQYGRFFIFATLSLLLIAAVAFYKNFRCSNYKVPTHLNIAKDEYRELDCFFQRLIYKEGFAYTLCGDKPISMTGFFDPVCPENVFVGRSDQVVKRGWAIWKNCHVLMNNYLLFEEKGDLDDNLTIITLVNKKAFLKTVNEHLDVFHQILGEAITAEALLEKLNENGANLFNLLKRNEGLYGILLGYGKANSFLFQRRQELNLTSIPAPFLLSKHTPSQGFSSCAEEVDFIKKEFQPMVDKSVLCPLLLPEFMALPEHRETVELLRAYRQTRRQIIECYSKGNCLEITLKRLCCM